MNIQQVKLKHHGFACICCHCGYIIGERRHEKEERYADLDGKPFASYYCTKCAKAVTEKNHE